MQPSMPPPPHSSAGPRSTPAERSALLLKLADAIDREAEAFAALEALNCGKPRIRVASSGSSSLWGIGGAGTAVCGIPPLSPPRSYRVITAKDRCCLRRGGRQCIVDGGDGALSARLRPAWVRSANHGRHAGGDDRRCGAGGRCGYAVSETAGNTAVIVKLFRVFLMLPVVLVIGWLFARRAMATAAKFRFPCSLSSSWPCAC